MIVNATFAMLKPDACRRALLGTILTRIEQAQISVTRIAAAEPGDRSTVAPFLNVLYSQHRERSFFRDLFAFMMSGRFYVLQLEQPTDAPSVVTTWRTMMGAATPGLRRPGEIRYDLARDAPIMQNLVHGSDSEDAAARELGLARHYFW